MSQESFLKDILIGSVSGSIGKLIEYPFDTIKVKLQTIHHYRDTFHCISQTFRNDGFNGFYKGLPIPLIGACFENSLLFSSYNFCLNNCFPSSNNEITYKVMSGGVSGIVASFVITPIELIKCRLQVSSDVNHSKTTTISSIILQTYRDNGLRGFWVGQFPTILREAGGTACWFGTYEYSTMKLRQLRSGENRQLDLLVSGALAGISYNLSLFPVDTIKSHIQISNNHQNGQVNFVKAAKTIYKSGGLLYFYRGVGVTLIRAIPSNAAIFYVYELLKKNI